MKLIALRNFLNVGKAIKLTPDQNPVNEMFIHKGAIFDIGTEAKYDDLQARDRQFISQLNYAQCVGDATDPKIVNAVKKELAAEAKSEAALKARTAEAKAG